MGYLTTVANKLDSKKYLISTTKFRREVWQTAVFRTGIYPFNLFSPIIRLHSTSEKKAFEIHSLLETLTQEYPRPRWKSLAKALEDDEKTTAAIMEINHATKTKKPTAVIETAITEEGMDWYLFRGLSNTSAVLRQKAIALSELLFEPLNLGVETAQMMSDAGYLELKQFDQSDIVNVQAETAAVLMHVVDRLSRKMRANDQNELLETLEGFVSDKIRENGMPSENFLDLLNRRYEEYANYRWTAEENEGESNTLFWEYSKNIANITNVGKNPVFNLTLTNLMLKQILRWNLGDLLKEK